MPQEGLGEMPQKTTIFFVLSILKEISLCKVFNNRQGKP